MVLLKETGSWSEEVTMQSSIWSMTEGQSLGCTPLVLDMSQFWCHCLSIASGNTWTFQNRAPESLNWQRFSRIQRNGFKLYKIIMIGAANTKHIILANFTQFSTMQWWFTVNNLLVLKEFYQHLHYQLNFIKILQNGLSRGRTWGSRR